MEFILKKGARLGAQFLLAAAAVVIAAATVAATQQIATAAVAQQQDHQNDPANIAAAETVVITHRNYLRDFLSDVAAHSKIFPGSFLVRGKCIVVLQFLWYSVFKK